MKSVAVCSSNRFAPEAIAFGKALEKLGVAVYFPHFYTHNYGSLEALPDQNAKRFIAMGLTHDHFNKIKKADAIFLFNKDGYTGVSVSMELGYAVALGKRIYALSDKDEEVCRKVLMEDFVTTPEELAQKLR